MTTKENNMTSEEKYKDSISNNTEESVIYYLVNTTKTFFDDDEDTVDVITGWELVTRSELEDYLKRFKTAEKKLCNSSVYIKQFQYGIFAYHNSKKY